MTDARKKPRELFCTQLVGSEQNNYIASTDESFINKMQWDENDVFRVCEVIEGDRESTIDYRPAYETSEIVRQKYYKEIRKYKLLAQELAEALTIHLISGDDCDESCDTWANEKCDCGKEALIKYRKAVEGK